MNSSTCNRSGVQPVSLTNLGILAVTVLSLLPPVLAQPLEPDSFIPRTDNYVGWLVPQPDGKIIAGGGFATLGGRGTGLVRLTPSGELDPTFTPPPSSTIFCLALQPDGEMVAGGSFAGPSRQSWSNLARLHADGSLDTNFNPSVDGIVFSLAQQADRKLLLGGYFGSISQQTRRRFGRLNVDGTLDPILTAGANATVFCVAAQPDGKALAGGYFTTFAGQPRNLLARLDLDGSLETNFNLGTVDDWGYGSSFEPYVNCLVVQPDGKIVVGGSFTNLCGQPRLSLGRINADGSLDMAFSPEVYARGVGPGTVRCLALQADGKILVGGWFTKLSGQACTNVGRLNPDGSLDTGLGMGGPAGSPPGSAVACIALQPDGKILVGGSFTSLGGQPRNNLGRLNNTDAAMENLSYDGSTITWRRSGTSPEVCRTTFDSSSNGVDWTDLGGGTRIPGGWQVTSVGLPAGYRLRARGYVTGGNHNGSSWFVTSYIGPPVVEEQPGTRTNYVGTTATFSVYAGGTRPLRYQWRRGTNDLSGATNATLILADVQPADGGAYSVAVSNSEGTQASAGALLTVLPRPVLHIKRANLAFQGGQFGFEVSGPVGQAVVVETSWDMRYWIPLSTNVLGNTPVPTSDSEAYQFSQGFYRVRALPP